MQDILPWAGAFLAATALALAVWAALSGIEIKQGWQRTGGPFARWLDARRREKFNAQLPEAIDTMANALRAGFSISQAFDSVVELGENPISEEFAILQRQLRIGMPFEEALESLSSRVGSDDLALVATAILVSRRTGGNVTEIFDRISSTIRGRMRVERRVKTLTAQGRLQGAIVSALPLVLGAAMFVLKPAMMSRFLFSWTGLAASAAVAVLIAAGWIMIRKITKIDV